MTLEEVIFAVPKCDHISIHDSNGSVAYDGVCSHTLISKQHPELLEKSVDLLRPFKDVLVIGLQ